jgi:Lsr2/Gas vesicle synthesis protein GvpL/GvpF
LPQRVAGSLAICRGRPVGNKVMATVTEVTLTCDVCGDTKDVKTRLFGLDGKAYEIDLCGKDGDGVSSVTAGYMARARKVTARPGHREGQRRHGGGRPVRGQLQPVMTRARRRGRGSLAGAVSSAPGGTKRKPAVRGGRRPRWAGLRLKLPVPGRWLRSAACRRTQPTPRRRPSGLDAVDIAFLAALSQEREVERVIDDLAREWEGRIDVQLLGPMAAYDFAGTPQPGN